MAIDPRFFPAQDEFDAGHSARENTDTDALQKSVSKENKSHSDNKVFDRDELVRRCGGDAGIAARIVGKFKLRSDDDVKGLEATVGEGNLDSVIETAHRLKGVAASMAAHRLAECYRTLEAKAREGDLSDAPALLRELKTETAKFNDALSDKMAVSLSR
jgi:HPt (histidine-containing phosphotransfer) domain-containing protein